MKTVHNARVQLLATLLNTAAGSSFTVGVAAPLASAYFYNPAGLTTRTVAMGAIVWITAAAMLHIIAIWTLGRLRE
jgi:RsiW-degrading membrane proteinase PrsW (M82 family)